MNLAPGGHTEWIDVTAEIAVTSFHGSPAGGGILIGRDESGSLRRAVVPSSTSLREPETGEVWRITGPERLHPEYGLQIQSKVALPLLPAGQTIIRYLATNRRFEGVGWATATRLWENLGEGLYAAIMRQDFTRIAAVVGPDKAVQIVQGFGLMADEIEVFQWLDRYGVDPRTAAAAASLWGRGSIKRITEDPYALSLLEPWRTVDDRGLRLGIAPTDPRRLLAAVEEALARQYRRGHTAADFQQIEWQLRPLLGRHAAASAHIAVDLAIETGRVLRHGEVLQSRAAWFMEREVERMLREHLARQTAPPSTTETDAAIAETEARDGFRLTSKQRQAVHMAISSPLSVLCGGAGTGKTTVVKAILDASERRCNRLPPDEQGMWQFPQVALAGRAAKRITEATGRQAMTIARFLRQLESGKPLKRGQLIFDESSMLDLPSLYRILTALSKEVDLLFIGDPAQLPPIGPGLPFHRLVESLIVPKVELDVIHRQADETGIPGVARAIRNGHFPELQRFDPARPLAQGVFLMPATLGQEGAAALEVFRAMAGRHPRLGEVNRLHDLEIQILCPTMNGPAGAKALNREIERIYMASQLPIHDWGLSVGSKVLWLKNDYNKAPLRNDVGKPILNVATGDPIYGGFMNGALGVIQRPTGKGAWVEFDDGAADEICAHDLETLTSGWAVSVHKAQGSAFRRVIVPVTHSRLLDRAMIYTAITRAVETVVLVGDSDLLRQIVGDEPTAWKRQETLRLDQVSI